MQNQREQIAIEALRHVAKCDPHGEAGKCAQNALHQIDQIDAAHLESQMAGDKDRTARLHNMAADRLGNVGHSPKTVGPMSPQEIEMGPGNMAQKTVNWENPKENLKPQNPEAYRMPGMINPGTATTQREERAKVDEAHEKNREQAMKDAQEHEKQRHEDKAHADKAQQVHEKGQHDLKANNLTVDKVGGGLDEKKKK